MKLKYKLNRLPSVEAVMAKHQITNQVILDQSNLDFITDLVHVFRPTGFNVGNERVSIQPLLQFLKDNEEFRLSLSTELNRILKPLKIRQLLSEAGIMQSRAFLKEMRTRLNAKLLPQQPEKNQIEYFLAQLFFFNSDYEWIINIPKEELVELYQLMSFKSLFAPYHSNNNLKEIFQACSLLTQRISGRALEEEILAMVPDFEYEKSPFLALERSVSRIDYRLALDNTGYITTAREEFQEYEQCLKECQAFIELAYNNSSIYGISMTVNHNLIRLRQQLTRLNRLIHLIVKEDSKSEAEQNVDFALELLRYHSSRNDIGQLLKENTENIAYEITTHTAKTGEHYITESAKEYRTMFYKSLGGGVVVGFLCIFKLMLSKVDTSQFGHAFYYSMNYSLGFITIYLLGFTLATKQPAMTAAALIRAIEEDRKKNVNGIASDSSFAELFSRVFRTQFIAFVGNVFAAFPVSLAIIWLWYYFTDYNLAGTKYPVLLNDISPFHSPLIFHSAIAGVFLFLSGIISGSISNRNKHNNVPYRIAEHPILKLTIGKDRALRLASWVEKKWPGVFSNFWFGVFMGTTASIGTFIGLNLDIRHITFASGNFALGLFGSQWDVPLKMIFFCILGIGVIGFVNFIVSFALSLFVAFKSRKIPTSELSNLFRMVWLYFRKRPYAFFFPVKPSTFLRQRQMQEKGEENSSSEEN